MKKFQEVTKCGMRCEVHRESHGYLFGTILDRDNWFAARWDLSGKNAIDGYGLLSLEPKKITKTVYLYQFGHEIMISQSACLAGDAWKLLGSKEVTFEIPNE